MSSGDQQVHGEKEEAQKRPHHAFWDTQPVIHTEEEIKVAEVKVGPIDTAKTIDDVQKEPVSIASTFEWWVPDLHSAEDIAQVYQLLCDNYVEDDDALFRFNYSPEFLQWAMTPPGYFHDWHIAVRKKSDKKLLAFISGIPVTIRLEKGGQPLRVCEINFLCVHKRLREKRMAPILIKEVTRRVNLRGIWQAVYTAGVVLTKAFSVARYYHRSLNPEKLVDVNFSRIPPMFERFQRPMEQLKKHYHLPDAPQLRHLRPMTPNDVPHLAILLNQYLSTFDVSVHWSDEEVAHWLLPRKGVLWSYVVEHPDTKVPTDFFSFYALPSTVISNPKHKLLNAAYTFYYIAQTVQLRALVNDALIIARSEGFDVFNTLNIMENEKFLQELKFGQGDGFLRYYMYNWALPEMQPKQLGLVMI